MNNDEIKNIIVLSLLQRNKLKELAPEFSWGNFVGAYGELVAIKHYDWEKAAPGRKGYDAINKQSKTIQIKTVYSSNQIKFKKGTRADLMLVIEVDDYANWNIVYYGPFEKVRVESNLTGNNDYSIGITTLRKIANDDYSPPEEISLTLENGKIITAYTREGLYQILIKKGYKLLPMTHINTRIKRRWELERAFGIKVPPNYSEVESYVEEIGYIWFPVRPTLDKNRTPLVSHFEKRIYIAQNYFCEDKGIPTWYVSEKLNLRWEVDRIILSYQERKKRK